VPAIVSTIVEVVVFRFRKDRPEYLVLRRSMTDELYPGIWQIVTGTIREAERAVDAALREVMEETGCSPRRFWTVPHANVFYDRSADAMHLSPMFAMQLETTAEPRLSDEHSAYEWLSVREAVRRLVWPGQRHGVHTVEEFIVGGEEAMRLGEIPL
jgi:8-oxo-dGTP pyrophosphatase MutT (NUDIX family)